MKLGINTHFIMKFGFEEGLQFCQKLGVEWMEVAATGPSAPNYCDVETLLKDAGERERWLDTYRSYGLDIYSFSGHGTPLMPDPELAQEYKQEFRRACELMEKLGITRMALVAGLPEGYPGGQLPMWIVNTDLPMFRSALEWQWEERLIPYWKEQGKIASDHGVTLCFEPQVNDMIHTPEKLMRLRDEVGDVVACNYDISHMWVQQIDPIQAIYDLGELIQNVHLKDTLIHETNRRRRGIFDSTSLKEPAKRSWTFTIPGWGHDEQVWREVIATLRLVGYDGILSLEMESEYIEIEEGLEKTAEFINPMLLKNPVGKSWWEITEIHKLWHEDDDSNSD